MLLRESYEVMEMLADLEVGACVVPLGAYTWQLVIHALVVVLNPIVMAGWVALLVRAADGTSLLWLTFYPALTTLSSSAVVLNAHTRCL